MRSLHGYKILHDRAMKRWGIWYKMLMEDDMTIQEIASSFKNPYTGKKYTRAAIYLGIKNYLESQNDHKNTTV